LRKEDQDPFAEAGTAEPSLLLDITTITIGKVEFMSYGAIWRSCLSVTFFKTIWVVHACASSPATQGKVPVWRTIAKITASKTWFRSATHQLWNF